MTDTDTMTQPEVNSYPPQGTPQDPASHPETNFPSGSIRMQGIKDELGAFQRVKANYQRLSK